MYSHTPCNVFYPLFVLFEVFGGIWYDNTDLFTVGDDFCCKRWDPRKKERDGTVPSAAGYVCLHWLGV